MWKKVNLLALFSSYSILLQDTVWGKHEFSSTVPFFCTSHEYTAVLINQSQNQTTV